MKHVCLTTCLDTSRTLNIPLRSTQEWLIDLPIERGGLGEMPSPFALLASATASCMAASIQNRAKQIDISAYGLRIESALEEQENAVTALVFSIFIPESLLPIQHEIESISRSCPVASILHPGMEIKLEISMLDFLPDPSDAF